MAITAEQIQKLREDTGAGIMDCKKALEEASGDLGKARQVLKSRGLERASKKSNRNTGAGFLTSYIHNNRVGVLLEIRCETDFVVKSDPFQALAQDLLMQIAAMGPKDVEALLTQAFVKDESLTIESLIKEVVAKIGENIQVERFCRYEI